MKGNSDRLRWELLSHRGRSWARLPRLQVDYIVGNGWTPCLEFADPEHAYVSNENVVRFGPVASGYQDNRVGVWQAAAGVACARVLPPNG